MIKLLDKSVYELIAAGEVIERPASVIKELVENSVDAGANRITVEIKNGGITYMRITDNGCGMAFEDVPLAFLRHATSKLSTADDLEKISTLGFRGEALASVAAVTKTEVVTKMSSDELGTLYQIEGGEETAYEKTGCPDGTTVIIRDLFYNTPARLKFMKKDVSEGNFVQSALDKLALAYPSIKFTFIRDGRTVFVTSGDSKLYSAIHSVFGKQFAASLTEADYSQNYVNVKGYISVPYACRGSRQMQYFFVNGRSVRNATCIAALEEGYRNSIMVGKFPACVLNIEIPPSETDINVSPSKTEVRFANERIVFQTICCAVKSAILNAENSKEIIIDNKSSQSFIQPSAEYTDDEDKRTAAFEIPTPEFDGVLSFSDKSVTSLNTTVLIDENEDEGEDENEDKDTENSNKYKEQTTDNNSYDEVEIEKPLKAKTYIQGRVDYSYIKRHETSEDKYEFINQSSLKIKENFSEAHIIDQECEPELRYIGELFKTYILCECGESFIIMDKHAAHERLRFEKLKKELENSSQLLIESVPLRISREEWTALSDNADYLESLGITLSFNDNGEVSVNAFPSLLENENIENTLQRIAQVLINGGRDIESELFDGILHTVACKGAIKANEKTSDKELEILAKRIWEDTSVRYCPHGRPIITKISKYELEKNFGRIQ